MSYARSPRPVFSITIGIKVISRFLAVFVRRNCSSVTRGRRTASLSQRVFERPGGSLVFSFRSRSRNRTRNRFSFFLLRVKSKHRLRLRKRGRRRKEDPHPRRRRRTLS